MTPASSLTLVTAQADDFETLVAIRIESMRASLEQIGRFDPVRARERFRLGFVPAYTRHIIVAGIKVGFVVLKPQDDGLLLDHLYIKPSAQGQGIGAAVLAQVFAEADALAACPGWRLARQRLQSLLYAPWLQADRKQRVRQLLCSHLPRDQ